MIAVIGSLSTDFVVTTNKLPERGETVTGENFQTTFGGKGANQAVAAARLGGKVNMFGCVGSDNFGHEIKNNLAANKVNTDNVKTAAGYPSGAAHITLYEHDNSIIYVPGANSQVTVEYIQSVQESLLENDYFVMQNEIPTDTIAYIIELAATYDKKVIYDPAPYAPISKELLFKCAYILPNESELRDLYGMDKEDALATLPNQLIVTLGEDGLAYHNGKKVVTVGPIKAEVVDTTGAGDTFAGAFVVALNDGKELADACHFGAVAASMAITKFGAQGGMPWLEELVQHSAFENKANALF